MKPNAGLFTRARMPASSRTVKSAWFSMAICIPKSSAAAAGFAENGHRLVGQPRHVMAFVADEEVAADASQQRRAQPLGDLQVMDDDLGLGDARRRSPASASKVLPFSAIGCQWKIEPMPNST